MQRCLPLITMPGLDCLGLFPGRLQWWSPGSSLEVWDWGFHTSIIFSSGYIHLSLHPPQWSSAWVEVLGGDGPVRASLLRWAAVNLMDLVKCFILLLDIYVAESPALFHSCLSSSSSSSGLGGAPPPGWCWCSTFICSPLFLLSFPEADLLVSRTFWLMLVFLFEMFVFGPVVFVWGYFVSAVLVIHNAEFNYLIFCFGVYL